MSNNDNNIYRKTGKWDLDEIEKLKAKYPDADLLALSEELNRSVRAIRDKAINLKIKRTFNNSVIGGQKFCSMCKKFHPIEEFYRNKRQPDGYEYYCKEYYRTKGAMTKERSKYEWVFVEEDYSYLVTNDNEVKGKVCTKCNEWKPLTEYYANKVNKRDGLHSKCKQCFKNK